ncbi:MAG: ABC transporter permease [Clostridiales bacterium]|jgi:ribose transport system permease protein|nr:ABC transporter permease [Clostridiales bacterium]
MNKVKKFIGGNSALFAFAVLFILAVVLKGSTFLQLNNIVNILRNNSIIGIAALGMTLIIITGGIDLSVGSQLVITGLVVITTINATGSIALGVIAGVVTGAILGGLTGLLVSKCKIPAFIVTLGTMTIYRSMSQYLLNGGGVMIKGPRADAYITISNANLFPRFPLPIFYWMLLAVIIYLFTKHTPTGRYIYAVGSNEKATLLSSINVNRVKIITYLISGVLVALAAVVETSRLGSINSASSGSSYEMDAIAAAVIGGTSMSGGRGKIFGTVMGTLTLGIINNMMNLLGVPPFLVGAVKGSIIIGAVLLQKRLNESAA